MTSEAHIVQLRTNSWLVLGIFWIAILFQLTALKNIWSIQTFSTIANMMVFLLLQIYAVKTIAFDSFHKKIWYYYIIPGVFIYVGVMINLGLNVISNLELVAYFGFALPWSAYLSMPGLLKRNSVNYKLLWRYFYYFMLASIILGLLDYLMYQKGLLNLRVLETSYGVFLGGRFSIFHMLEDGTPHYRFYANFIEPGSLAMWLLPIIAYAFFAKKYISLTILSIGLFLTYSLGGWISFLLLVIVIFYIKLNHKTRNKYIALVATIILLPIMSFIFTPSLIVIYDSKQSTASVRIKNVTKAIDDLPSIILSNPMGIDIAIDTESNMENEAYIGSNFAPVVYFQNGGVLALFGYVAVLLFSFLFSLKSLQRNDLTLEEKVVFSSIVCLMPFIVQRTTIFESAVFAFLYAPVIIGRLTKIKRIGEQCRSNPGLVNY